jgi:GNAT superfamily N-acetyltransferase
MTEQLSFLEEAWATMERIVLDGQEEQTIRLSEEYEFRFLRTPAEEWSIVLADRQVNIFHFIWKEVEGAVELTHRIIHPDFRGRGLGTKLFQLIQRRVQRLADMHQQPYRFGLQTSQLAVINLCKKIGLVMTEGREYFDELKFDMEPVSTHLSYKGFRINFSMCQFVHPRTSEESP